MAFSSDLATSSGTGTPGTGNAITFALTGYPGPGKSERLDTTASPATPHKLEFSNRQEGGAKPRFIRSATIRQIKMNASNESVEGSATVTLRIPADTTVTQADVESMAVRLANLLLNDSTNRGRFARGEV